MAGQCSSQRELMAVPGAKPHPRTVLRRAWALVLPVLFLGCRTIVASPILIDHTSVELYDKIPAPYIEWIKSKWLTVPGESHSLGYRLGLQLLEQQDARFDVNVQESGTPEGPASTHMRVSKASWGDVTHATGWRYSYGEEDWFTSGQAVTQTLAFLTYANTNGLPIGAVGFGWCWDATWHNSPDGTVDPVYNVRWAGSSVGGPEGDLRWGLDADDQALTGNSVCTDTYLAATQTFADHCRSKGYETRVFFTTGPVDGYTGEGGYQRHLKYEHIRKYVAESSGECLFDYADILAWSNAGTQNLQTWTDSLGNPRQYPMIHADNMLDLDGTYAEDGDHIGQRGALRLGKALWVMMARQAGWDPAGARATRLGACVTPGFFDVIFPAYPGYTHQLQRSSNLLSWEDVPGASMPGCGGDGVFCVDCRVASRMFWRIVPLKP